MTAPRVAAAAKPRLWFRAVLGALDSSLLRVLRTRAHAPPVERAVLLYTRSGEHGAVWLALSAAGAALDPDRRPLFSRAARATLAAYGLNTLVKYAVRRRRPLLDGLPPLTATISRFSYPSAHSSTAFAAAGALGEAWPRPPVYAAAAVMALSRPYAGVHYPSDVVAGALLGTAAARLAS